MSSKLALRNRTGISRFALLLLAILIPTAVCQPLSNTPKGLFRTMEISPKTLAVTLSDPLPDSSETNGPFFMPFHYPTGDYTVEHYDGKHAYPNRVRYSLFGVSEWGILQYRTKAQELLRGPFGTIYANTKFFYSREGAAIEFSVRPYASEMEHEPAQVVEQLPAESSLWLDAISVVRVFVSPPGFIVVTGQYSKDGFLDNVVIDGAKDGNWIHTSRIGELDESLRAGEDFRALQKKFGFPGPFPVTDYLTTGTAVWGTGDRPCFTTIVNFHYERNRWVRQDSFDSTGLKSTRFLTYEVTAQDRDLEPVDQGLRFLPQISRR